MGMATDIGRLSSAARSDLAVVWPGGRLQIASRERTDHVDGTLQSDHHLIMATLRGGARHHSYLTDDGLRYEGRDACGMVSFLPAGCRRKLELQDVCWTWAAFCVAPSDDDPSDLRSLQFAGEPLLFHLFRALEDLSARDNRLDGALAASMSSTAWGYVVARHLTRARPEQAPLLPAWRLRRVRDYIEANLSGRIAVADLAAVCSLSERQFHRALLQTVGQTPIAMINVVRAERAKQHLLQPDASILEVARRVGFESPTYFARVFRGVTGLTPARWRAHNQ